MRWSGEKRSRDGLEGGKVRETAKTEREFKGWPGSTVY